MTEATAQAGQHGEHPLYKAAVCFMVSQRTEGEAWDNIAQFVEKHKGNAKELDAAFSMIEAQIKKDFSITAMPGAWRSAKAVARKAFRKGIALIDSTDGSVYGKTLVEHTMKNGGAVPAKMTPGAKARYMIDNLQAHLASPGFIWDNTMQKADFLAVLHTISTTI